MVERWLPGERATAAKLNRIADQVVEAAQDGLDGRLSKGGGLGDLEDLLGATGNLRFLALGTGGTPRSLLAKLRQLPVSPEDFGAVGDGAADDTAAVRLMAASGARSFSLPGRYRITDRIVFPTGSFAAGRYRAFSGFVIDAGFNMAADCVVQLGTAEPGATMDEVGFFFAQPVTSSRAALIKYPPAIKTTAPRGVLGAIRIEGAWDGIDARGNSGGMKSRLLEIGAANKGLQIDGALDFWHADTIHLWPFGFSDDARLAAYSDGGAVGLEVGRCDGLAISKLSTFRTAILMTATGGGSSGRTITTLQLDGDGARLAVAAGPLNIGDVYSTKNAGPTIPSILIAGGETRIGVLDSRTSAATSDVKVMGGELVIGGGRMNQNNLSQRAFEVTGGRLDITGIYFAMLANALRTVPLVEKSGGQLGMAGCSFPVIGSGTGAAVAIGADNTLDRVTGNHFGGRAMTLPAGASAGCYGPNKEPLRSFVPVLTFATPGDFNPTYVLQQGRYRYETNGIWFQARVVLNTNAFTTAAGGAKITGLPVANGGMDGVGFPLGNVSRVDLDTGFSWAGATLGAGSTELVLRQYGDNIAQAGLGTGNIKPSISGIEITVSGFVPFA